MTFNLFGGFKFAAPASPAACNTGGSPATAGHGLLGGNLFGNAGGLFGGGHSILDNLLGHHDNDHHDDSHHDSHGGHGNSHCEPGHSGGGSGGSANAGNDFPPIPSDTLGVTFSVDLNGDGINDEYAVVKAPDNPTAQDQTLQHYYDQVAKDLAETHPDVPTNQIVVKATIYSASQGESYYHFNGDETTTDEQNADNGHDHHGDPDYDHNHEHDGHNGHDNDHASGDHGSNCGPNDHGSKDHGSNDHGSDNHGSHDGGKDCGSAQGDHDSNFYSHLMSWTAGSHDDKEPAPEHEDDHQEEGHGHDFHFC
jgi:hypothetical protein